MTSLRDLDKAIVAESLARVREEAAEQEIRSRVYRVPEEAVEAYRLACLRHHIYLRVVR